MARIRVFIVLALAVAAGGTFAYGTYQYMQNVPKSTPGASIPTSAVIVAASDLQLGAALRQEDLRAIQWPSDAVPAGAFGKPEELIGRGLIQPVVANELFLPSKLASKEAGAGLPPVIPEGQRALSVRVNDVVGVAGYVLPGTRVDVVATVNPTQQQTDVTSKVILTNVQVLAAGTKIEQDEKNKPIAVSVVTLLVNPDEAERLTLASTEGKIQLALRNPLDKTAPVTSGIRPAGLMGSAPPVRRVASSRSVAPRQLQAAPPAPAPAPTVEIIRGDKRAQEVVAQE
ncbi:MAG TPA: Flp pilus assembly protein CpaB [Vicinamibacterales bacterium]|nr:Flp pilus assembly protein CpaB [Vicinamibacterales bacterium]